MTINIYIYISIPNTGQFLKLLYSMGYFIGKIEEFAKNTQSKIAVINILTELNPQPSIYSGKLFLIIKKKPV